VENCRFIDNETGKFYLASFDDNSDEFTLDIVNCEFTGSEYYNSEDLTYPVSFSIFGFGGMDLNIINCTFAENHLYGINMTSSPVRILYGMDVEIVNSIFYNNSSHSLIIQGNYDPMPVVDIHHSIIENGMNSVLTSGSYILNWDEDTIWDADPLFLGEMEYPYKLQSASPAIDVGTLDFPEGYLPEYDLAGNLRIYGEGIDLGCYEWQPENTVNNEIIAVDNDLYVYPNPVNFDKLRNGHVQILWQGEAVEGEIEFEIFNIKGQKVRKIEEISETENGRWQANWDLKSESGNKVSSGVYFIRIKIDGQYQAQRKVTVVN